MFPAGVENVPYATTTMEALYLENQSLKATIVLLQRNIEELQGALADASSISVAKQVSVRVSGESLEDCETFNISQHEWAQFLNFRKKYYLTFANI
jgi:hypothetical protein